MKSHIKILFFTLMISNSFAQTNITSLINGVGATNTGYFTRYDGAYSVRNSGMYQYFGNIGIGTLAPVAPFHVSVNNNSNIGIRIDQANNSAAAISLINTNGGRNWGLFSTGAGNTGGIGNFAIYDNTALKTRLLINSTGNILVGDPASTPPLAKLHVHDGALRLTGAVAGYGGPMILWGGNTVTATSGEWGLEYQTSVPGFEGMNFWKPSGATGVNGNYFLFLANTGKVGINTNNPTAQLTVNGNVLIGDPANVCIPNTNYKLFVQTGILTEKVKVAINCTANWSDYVFDKNYKLMNLQNLENYINSNKHLPNIPTAEEVVKEGVDLGEMTSKLLGKVEELTLYTIEQNKKIEELQKKILELKNK